MKEEILFKETQKFNQWWLWLLIIAVAIPLLLQFNFKDDIIEQFTSDKIIPSVIFGVVLVLFLACKLTTVITQDKITIYYIPFFKKEFLWQDLNHAQVIDYGFVGGWGIRLWTQYGTVYNVRGSKGLHIKTGAKQFLIGSQKEEELRSSIAHLLK